jgi:hypothetical protein
MEQLADAIIKALGESPQIALWVLAIIYGFKVVVVGSIFGVIKFTVEKLHNYATTPKHTLSRVDIEPILRGHVISGQLDALIAQITRIKYFGGGMDGYVHDKDVEWLRKAIDAHMIASPRNNGESK